jgi:ATP-binding cassette, subfamily B, bacterial
MAFRNMQNLMMSVLRFIFQIFRPYKLYFLGLCSSCFLIAFGNVAQTFLIKKFIDLISGQSQDPLLLILGMYSIIQVGFVLSWRLYDWCFLRYSAYFRADTAAVFLKRLSVYAYSFFQNTFSGGIVSKVGDAFHLTPHLISTLFFPLGFCFFLSCLSLLVLSSIHILFSALLLGWIFFFWGLTFHSMKKGVFFGKDYAQVKSSILGQISDYIYNILTVKMFAAEAFENQRYQDARHHFIQTSHRQGYFLMNFYSQKGLLCLFYKLFILALLLYLHFYQSLTAGDFGLVMMVNLGLIDLFFSASGQLKEFITNWGNVDQAVQLLDQPILIQDAASAKALQITRGTIEFLDISFQYVEKAPLFKNLSVRIEGGSRVGLVGFSGGGKTTFVHLILRLYDIFSGQILIDGQNIQAVSQNSLRSSVTMIPQETSLFHRSLKENIRYGNLHASDEEIIQVCQKALAHDFIQSFPNGYDTMVGERGVKLSGGQKQRIAIARALLKDAPIMILDEATSHLDSVTEYNLQDNLMPAGKTLLVIAHRLSTLLTMDRILVFDQGQIVQDGIHADLIQQPGLYQKLWNQQGYLNSQT